MNYKADDPTNIPATYAITSDPNLTSQNSATVSVMDIPNPTLSIEYPGSAITEGETAMFTVKASENPLRNLTINYTPENDSPGDFLKVETSDPTLNLGASGDMRRFEIAKAMWIETTVNSVTTWNAQISIPTDNDDDDELQGTITVTLNDPATSVPNDYTVSTVPSEQSATVTINDNDAPEISIAEPAPSTQIVAGDDIELTLTASQQPAADLQIRFKPTETNTNFLNPNSVTESDGTTVRPGGASGVVRTSEALEFTIVGSGPMYSATLKIATQDNSATSDTTGSILVELQNDDPAGSTYTITSDPTKSNQNDCHRVGN